MFINIYGKLWERCSYERCGRSWLTLNNLNEGTYIANLSADIELFNWSCWLAWCKNYDLKSSQIRLYYLFDLPLWVQGLNQVKGQMDHIKVTTVAVVPSSLTLGWYVIITRVASLCDWMPERYSYWIHEIINNANLLIY